MFRVCIFTFLSAASTIWVGGTTGVAAPDFEKEIAPILEANCLACHNENDAKGDLILSNSKQAFAFENGILPGKADASLLIEMISGAEPEMPKKADPLSATEINSLRRWIEAGANWPEGRVLKDNPKRDLDWWSLRPIQQGRVDDSTGLSRTVNPVDFVVSKKLAEKKLTPTGLADPTILIRRVT